MKTIEKLWGGRFNVLPSQEIIDFLSGRDVRGVSACDERLVSYDLWGSRVHAVMLCKRGIISPRDGKKILKGLREIDSLYRTGKFKLDPSKEDVHSNIESLLVSRIGIESGGKLHTGRSRNDQIALDMRLYLRDQALELGDGVIRLIEVLLKRAEEHRGTVMPGYTHHQHAMATTFGHLLLAFAEGLQRDQQRLAHWLDVFNKNPLGAGAGYGTSFKVDRNMTSKLLGFDGPTENATDPVMQRWEPEADLAYAVGVTMNHLSTLAQTFILLSTREFGLVRLDDRHCSGSSIMPQKRNPDSLEVIKAKAAFAQGILTSLLSVGKGLFMGYNRETQWTKYWIMDLVDESEPALSIMTDVVKRIRVNKAEMLEQARRDFLGATALMEWMTASFALPLREVKTAIEKAVRYSEMEGLEEVSYASLKRALQEMKIDVSIRKKDVETVQRPEGWLVRAQAIGMPSEKRVQEGIASMSKRLNLTRGAMIARKRGLEKAKEALSKMEKALSR